MKSLLFRTTIIAALACLPPFSFSPCGGGWPRVTAAFATAGVTPPPRFAPDPGSLAGNGAQDSPVPNLDDLPYFPGRIILKLSDQLGAVVAKARVAAAAGSGSPAGFGVAGLDRLNRRYGFRSMRRPFAARASRVKAQLSRFAERAARAPVGAAAPNLENVFILELSRFLDMEKVARQYAAIPGVVYAEPDRKAHAELFTNDPFLSSHGSWGQSFPDLWGLHNIAAPAAWDLTAGAGLVIAITDTGIDRDHPDITSQIWVNPGEIPANGLDDDNNGYVDDEWGWDFANDDNDPYDDYGHGTHVAGIAAASGNNGVGIAGVAWQASTMALKGLDQNGLGWFSDLASAILYAVDNGADVINASWGGSDSSHLLADAIATAHAAGVVFVAAAGNSGEDVGSFSPASDPNVITVSAFDHYDRIASFSNFGPKIDVAAPGGGDKDPAGIYDPFRSILSLRSSGAGAAFPDALTVAGIYARQAGTSMAAPYVAGAAALVLARHPEFSVEQVRQVLRATADDVETPGVDINSGYGRLNVGRAVLVDEALEVEISSPPQKEVVSRSLVEVIGTVAGTGFTSYTVQYGAGDYPTEWTTIAGPVATPTANDVLAVWDLSQVPDADYTIRVFGSTAAGYTFEDRVQVTVDRVIISSPQSYNIYRAGGPIEVRGSASGVGFQDFTVEYRVIEPDLSEGAWVTTGLTLTGGGVASVEEDVLAVFDSSIITEGRDLDFRLIVNRASGQTTRELYHVVIEPTLRAGWPRQIPGLPDYYRRMEGHVTIADLDGDGTKEILAAYGDLVFVFRDDGSDFPGWPQSIAEPDHNAFVQSAPAAADLDNDGDLEIVTGNRKSIFIWHHDGTPFAGWPREFIYTAKGWTRGVPTGYYTLADLDGDGFRDIIFSWGAALAAVRTDGTFLPGFPVELDTTLLSPSPFEHQLAVGDTDGDGSPEIAAVERIVPRGGLLHLYGADAQQKPGWPRKIVRRRYSDNAPIMADLDGDGILDIVANTDKVKRLAAYHGNLRKVRLRTKIPEFRWHAPRLSKFRAAQEDISAGDIDGDGRAEIFVSTHWPQVHTRCRGIMCTWTWLLPPHNGTDYLQVVSSRLKNVPGWPAAFYFPRGDNAHGPGTAAIGDIDGDGVQDAVIGSGICAYWDYQIGFHRCYTIYAFSADGTLLPGFPKPTASPGATKSIMPAIGDLDGDGLKEIVWVDFEGRVLVWNVAGTPGPENMQWPMFRHDPAHTGALR